MGTSEIGIGSTVWFEEAGKTLAATIVGETPRKWVAKQGNSWREWSFPKTGDDVREGRGPRNWKREVFITKAAAEAFIEADRAAALERSWLRKHRWNIAKRVENEASFEQLRQIAALVGYDDKAGA